MASVFVIIWGIRSSAYIINPILLALVITITVAPLPARLKQRGIPGWLSLVLTIVVVVGGLLLVLAFSAYAVGKLATAIPELVASASEQQAAALNQTQQGLAAVGLSLAQIIQPEQVAVVGFKVVEIVGRSIFQIFIVLLIFGFMLSAAIAAPRTGRLGLDPDQPIVERATRFTGDILRYVSIMTLVNLLVGLGDTVILLIIGVDFAVLWGLLAWVLGYTPSVGFWLALVPPVLLAYAEFGLGTALIVFVAYVLINGARQKFFVIPMASGNRKLLMYDLTARIVDADSLPINMVVVSSWARTGWNVITPNVLIDATATRDVTAWQQLRGRAIRARRSWTNDCYRLLTALIGTLKADANPLEQEEMPDDVAEILQRVEQQQPGIVLDERLLALLADAATVEVVERVQAEGLSSLTDEERTGVAIALMRKHNKVTHIFELVKAYGSTTQVEYNRTVRVWQRRESIAAKHEYEVSVNPFSGEKLTGAGHAPLVYAQDPRADVPAELQQHLIQAIAGSDDLIVAGWLRYGLSDQAIGEEGQPGG